MSDSYFDAAGFLEVDLNNGCIRSRADDQLALVPWDVLATLNGNELLGAVAHAWGERHAKQLTAQSGGDLTTIDLSAISDHLGGTLATLGMGTLSVVIHGNALLFKAVARESSAPGYAKLLSGFIKGYLHILSPHEFAVPVLETTDAHVILFAGNANAAQTLQSYIGQGLSPLAAVERLNREVH